ncbi:Possible hemagglutinin (DUF637) [Moraxella caprae]|uniref:Possible hemagglutinin (DUF637) n=1 Tax=Moraxella caprae TaxID=90240 RepID=A0A378QY24_9GAMM|nr:VENN motif pre-toxin domain-containing protein [Moraxella caprae]STZ07688.1 Possible hemagglutinin (DUF637) [Moraxella caprae]
MLTELGAQVTITQAFDAERRAIRSEFAQKAEDYRKEAKDLPNDDPRKAELEEKAKQIDDSLRLFDGITSALYAPNSNGIIGDVARAASPELAYRIGQEFKENKILNQADNGNRPEEQSLQHLLAHAVLGAATSYATGNNIATGALAGVTSEKTAPILASYLYGKDPKELSQEQKDTITNIITLGTAGIAYGATGDVSSAVNNLDVSRNVVEWNYLQNTLMKDGRRIKVPASDEIRVYNYYELLVRIGLIDIDDVPNDVFESIAKTGLVDQENVTTDDVKEVMSGDVLEYKQGRLPLINPDFFDYNQIENLDNISYFQQNPNTKNLLDILKNNPKVSVSSSEDVASNINLIYTRDFDIIQKTGWRKYVPFLNDPEVKYGDFQLSEIIINANNQGISEIYQTPKVYPHNYNSGDYSTEIRTGSSFDTLGSPVEESDYVAAFKEGWSIGVETGLANDPVLQTGKVALGALAGVNPRKIDERLLKQVVLNAEKGHIAYSKGAIGNKIIDDSGFGNFSKNELRAGLDGTSNDSIRWHSFPGVTKGVDDRQLIINDKEAYLKGLAKIYEASGQKLNGRTEKLISDSIDRNNIYSVRNGLPGTHAEIRTYNSITSRYPNVKDKDISIATARAGEDYRIGESFPACTSCTSILPKEVNIPTGRIQPLPKGSKQDGKTYKREE